MIVDNRLVQALLVACDQSYNPDRTTGIPLVSFPDSGGNLASDGDVEGCSPKRIVGGRFTAEKIQ